MGAFDGGTITSDAGALLLGQTDKAIHLVSRLADCFQDGRNRAFVVHQLPVMLSQRIFGIALGYERTSSTTTSCAMILCSASSAKR